MENGKTYSASEEKFTPEWPHNNNSLSLCEPVN